MDQWYHEHMKSYSWTLENEKRKNMSGRLVFFLLPDKAKQTTSESQSEFTFEWHASIVLKYVSTIGLVWFQRRVVSLSPEVQFPRSGGYRLSSRNVEASPPKQY